MSITTCRVLADLVEAVRVAAEASPERSACASRARPRAEALAPLLPLVHRTGRENGAPWWQIFSELRLRAEPFSEDRLERRLGWGQVVFFFLGHAAYPHGGVAFVLAQSFVAETTFTPYDTGAVASGKYLVPSDQRPWGPDERVAHMRDHLGTGGDVAAFALAFLSAHLEDPDEYVRRPQQSDPDHPVYHGLASPVGDRRAWTIEVQAHTEVPLSPPRLRRVLVERNFEDLEIPDALLDSVALWDPERDETFEIFIIRQIWDILNTGAREAA